MAHFDYDLLFLYSENSRAKIRDLALQLKKSPQRLKYSMRQLEKDAILHNPHCIIDYSYFGQNLFRVYFKGGYISETDKTEIIKKLSENPYIVSMYELSGEFDLAIEIESPNPSRFKKELNKVTSMIPTLSNYKILLNVVTHIYPRFYLLKDQKVLRIIRNDIIIGGDKPIGDFSENEMKVMKNLLVNPKTRMTQLAKNSQLNIKTAIGVYKNLKERGIIRGFKYVIDTNKIEANKFRLFLKLHHTTAERENQLMQHLHSFKEIVQVNKTVGDWDMEIDIESLDRTRIRYIIIQVRQTFKDIIETFNLIEFYQYYKKSYLPMQLFVGESSQF